MSAVNSIGLILIIKLEFNIIPSSNYSESISLIRIELVLVHLLTISIGCARVFCFIVLEYYGWWLFQI